MAKKVTGYIKLQILIGQNVSYTVQGKDIIIKKKSNQATNLEALREATRMDVATDYREHERLLQQAESIARNLPEPTCTVLRLCYYEHKTYREAAEQLGISPDTVKKHISKALRTLREAMTLKGGTDDGREKRK